MPRKQAGNHPFRLENVPRHEVVRFALWEVFERLGV